MPRALPLAILLLSGGCLVLNPDYDPGQNSGGGAATTTSGTTDAPGGAPPTTGSDSSGAAACGSHDDCANGLFCDGEELCDPGSAGADARGCVAARPPCGVDTTCSEDQDACLTACEVDADNDDDGVDGVQCGGDDCDDADPEVHPGRQEVCDDADVDEDCDPSTFGSLDADGDGEVSRECCNLADGVPNCGDDCDDALAGVDVGDWAHCGACGASCGARQACIDNHCVSARRVFVTSATYDGDLGGLGGADMRCQKHADAVGLGGTFKAFMVDKNQNLDRLEHPDVPFVRLDGVKIADGWSDLADESLDAPLALTELRTEVGGNAWTGLYNVNGSPLTNSCHDWTSAAPGCDDNNDICGAAGELAATDNHWDGFWIFKCHQTHALYCVEQ